MVSRVATQQEERASLSVAFLCSPLPAWGFSWCCGFLPQTNDKHVTFISNLHAVYINDGRNHVIHFNFIYIAQITISAATKQRKQRNPNNRMTAPPSKCFNRKKAPAETSAPTSVEKSQ